MREKEGRKDFFKRMFYLSTMGLSMAFAIFIGLGVGIFLDNHYKTHPLFTMILLIAGILAGFRNIYVLFVKYGLQKGKKDVGDEIKDASKKIPDWAISMGKKRDVRGKETKKSSDSSTSNSNK
ncbi:MAG: AtpZ/AtpI family protein [Deltaproteobacteria bacterium]|uniref:AtpZ/AtpI family protein n=1 Tax=Candidatus Zymogenus saltonus TaxID=2844893 RepID=A0A9D8PN68_9DELT|nr:AtpZ/AtpI family protein [Candidatus Zymogenus saltonus]